MNQEKMKVGCAVCGTELEVTVSENGEIVDWEGHYWEPGEVTDDHYFECDSCKER